VDPRLGRLPVRRGAFARQPGRRLLRAVDGGVRATRAKRRLSVRLWQGGILPAGVRRRAGHRRRRRPFAPCRRINLGIARLLLRVDRAHRSLATQGDGRHLMADRPGVDRCGGRRADGARAALGRLAASIRRGRRPARCRVARTGHRTVRADAARAGAGRRASPSCARAAQGIACSCASGPIDGYPAQAARPRGGSCPRERSLNPRTTNRMPVAMA